MYETCSSFQHSENIIGQGFRIPELCSIIWENLYNTKVKRFVVHPSAKVTRFFSQNSYKNETVSEVYFQHYLHNTGANMSCIVEVTSLKTNWHCWSLIRNIEILIEISACNRKLLSYLRKAPKRIYEISEKINTVSELRDTPPVIVLMARGMGQLLREVD